MSGRPFAAIILAFSFSLSLSAQTVGSIPYRSQELDEADGLPVLLKHLPEWEAHRSSMAFAASPAELKARLGERPLIDEIDFTAGAEAVTADYDAGKLVIVEIPSPQVSVETDAKLSAAIAAAGDKTTFIRRIGNYNVIVFDAASERAANALIDEVKYEKQITWLGKNPFAISAERAFVMTTADIFFSTLMVIVGGIIVSIVGGILIGYFFFFFRDGKRSKTHAYTDAGGMTRLNLDGFTPDIAPERLLGE